MLLQGDCLNRLKELESNSIDLIYLDPPFFTQKTHKSVNRENTEEYSFDDKWESIHEYRMYIEERLEECKRVLKNTGSIFLHCDKSASHHLRVALDNIFGMNNFQSEIIWRYKRWSNSKKGLLNNHQNIYFYSKSKQFKFNCLYEDYSETTNIDQILQDRVKDKHGKSQYKKDENGDVIIGKEKKGVPLSDIWDIPYLNPKAAERVGYPTQKPILLLEKILSIATDEGDVVLDPFMGSGTTLVAAKLMNRKYIGIDKSKEAISLAQSRLENPIKTESDLIKKGKSAYINKSDEELKILEEIGALVVRRNKGIDGFLKEYYKGAPVSIKIQKEDETLLEAGKKLLSASKSKKSKLVILIRTKNESQYNEELNKIKQDIELLVIDRYSLKIKDYIEKNNYMKES